MTWFRKLRDEAYARIALAKCYSDSGLVNNAHYFSVSPIQFENRYFKTFVRLVVRREIDGELICFSGTSESSIKLAAQKAFSEYLEAKTIWSLGVLVENGRSGWATFTTMSGAFQRAYQELVERDSFLTHVLTPSLSTRRIVNTTIPDLQACELQSADCSFKVVLAGQKQQKSGIWLLGLGSCAETEEALDIAVQEVMMLRFQFMDHGPISETTEFNLGHFRNHLISAGESAMSSRIISLFKGGGDLSLTYQTQQCDSKLTHSLVYGKLSVAHVTHSTLIPLTFGANWKSSQMEIAARLQRKGITDFSWAIHPFL